MLGRILASLLATVAPMVVVAPAHAVHGGLPATLNVGQIEIFDDGTAVGGGTIIDRNWILTSLQVLRRWDHPNRYRLQIGGVGEPLAVRYADRIVPHPVADLALVHFAEPTPASIWIPRLATESPQSTSRVFVYGWGATNGQTLDRISTIVYDRAATVNLAALRQSNIGFGWGFTYSAPPLVLNATSTLSNELDTGSGTLVIPGVLIGVHAGSGLYRTPRNNGSFGGGMHMLMYDQPVWHYREWIQSVIHGEGTSGSAPPVASNDELRRRRLSGAPPDSDARTNPELPVTLPPDSADGCPVSTLCGNSWTLATLVGDDASTGRSQAGEVPARCATANGRCRFDGTTYPTGAAERLRLETGGRNIMIWCAGEAQLRSAEPAEPAYRVSFLNNDSAERGDSAPVPEASGLWDVPRTDVTAANADLAPC